MSLGTEVGLSPGHIVLDGDPARPPPTERGTAAPTFRPVSVVAKRSHISATAELLFTRAYSGGFCAYPLRSTQGMFLCGSIFCGVTEAAVFSLKFLLILSVSRCYQSVSNVRCIAFGDGLRKDDTGLQSTDSVQS